MNFKLNSKEVKKAKAIHKEYFEKYGCWPKVSYIFSPTGLGDNIILITSSPLSNSGFPFSKLCKVFKITGLIRFLTTKKYDITDYSSW